MEYLVWKTQRVYALTGRPRCLLRIPHGLPTHRYKFILIFMLAKDARVTGPEDSIPQLAVLMLEKLRGMLQQVCITDLDDLSELVGLACSCIMI